MLGVCSMTQPQSPPKKAPLEGKTLEMILNELVAHYGWDAMGQEVRINCFVSDPSIASSLKFLRRTPWARAQVEEMYLGYLAIRESESYHD